MDSFAPSAPVVAVVGGGQLARMMQESAIALGIELRPLVEAADGSTGQVVVSSRVGAASDLAAVARTARGADVLTFEHEHVPQSLLAGLPADLPVHPGRHALVFAQDKLAMRERLTELGIACPAWARVTCRQDLEHFADRVGWPVVLKTPVGGYDGHGVRIVEQDEDVEDWFAAGTPLLAEEKVPFVAEAAALLARSPSGEIRSWPVAATIQEGGVCSVVIAPAPDLPDEVAEEARRIAERIAAELDVTGVLAVEMFVVKSADGLGVLVNELAMRPHNSGHWTIDGSLTSQFEQHLRAVLDLPLGSTDMVRPGACAVMVNLLGSTLAQPARALGAALQAGDDVKVHLYGKEVRPGRKLGHVAVVDADPGQARSRATRAVDALAGRSTKRAD
ncbi:5-(carboxyamino)imidazole ribonucleotide synthase [Schaalia sp. 19OD2882]|uniref:5-(carboxyamino)imidazole ribonucleotide synthase n=1 Tax=Schaalia sp. 19OD2882 TaxID=2794089 RepID=UPI001C1EA57A|nr:5-(carboxyamino)imidazole ribonucleotide synthase [Schaalia sp. 19OD2882]QWW20248.1 5-(carboxyamino)imidazole ribonucleotide synthase [Schaalia sp. 19OD2882]